MANSVGSIQFDLGLNQKAFNNGLKSAEKSAKNASGGIGSALGSIGKAAIAAFSVKAIINFGKQCLELGSDLAEVQNVVDVTFGSMSENVNEFSKNAITSFGLSEKVAKQYMGTFGAMSKAFGSGTAEAYKQAEALTALSGDVASFYNLSTDEAFTKLKSVYTGETESLKSLGVVMTQTALDAFAMSNGFGKTTKEMSEQEKVALRLAFVQDKLSAASGDFARTSDGWANQTRVLSLRFDALKASIGQGLINALTPVIKLLNQLMAKLQVVAEAFSQFMSKIFGDAGSSTAAAMSDAADNLSVGMADGAKSAKEIKQNLSGLDQINTYATASAESTDSASVGGGGSIEMPTLKTGKSENNLSKLGKELDKIRDKLKILSQETGLSSLFDKLKASADNFKASIQNLTGPVSKGVSKAMPSIKTFLNNARTTFTTVTNTISTIWGDMWLGISEHSKKWTEENEGKITEFTSGILDNFANFGILISSIVGGIFESVLKWWEESGKPLFDGVLSAIDDIKTWILDLWNEVINPVVSKIIAKAQELWDEHLHPLWDQVLSFITSVGNFLLMLWNKILKPIGNWIVGNIFPAIKNALRIAIDFIGDAIGIVVDLIKGILKSLGGLLDFVTGVFTGDWEKAWNGIKDFISGIFDGIWGAVKGTINLIIDGLNALWNGLYTALRAIVNGVGSLVEKIGEVMGQDDWGWTIPADPPMIPRLANGGFVKANTPQLAIVGDNKREGEIISPESKIAEAVERGIAKVVGNQDNGNYTFIAELDGEVIFKKVIQKAQAKKRSNGKNPLLV